MFDSMFVSIHAPRAGGDLIVGAMRIGFRVSIHAPRAGGDLRDSVDVNMEAVSIHAPRAGGDITCRKQLHALQIACHKCDY